MVQVLGAGEAGVEAAACGPARRGAPVSTTRPAVDHIDAVGAAHGRQAVGDQDGGAPGHQPLQRRLHLGLALGVEGAGGLVEQQDRRVLQERAGDGDPLALAAGEPRAGLADPGVVALGQGQDEVVRPRPARAAASISRLGGVGLA